MYLQGSCAIEVLKSIKRNLQMQNNPPLYRNVGSSKSWIFQPLLHMTYIYIYVYEDSEEIHDVHDIHKKSEHRAMHIGRVKSLGTMP